MATNIR